MPPPQNYLKSRQFLSSWSKLHKHLTLKMWLEGIKLLNLNSQDLIVTHFLFNWFGEFGVRPR